MLDRLYEVQVLDCCQVDIRIRTMIHKIILQRRIKKYEVEANSQDVCSFKAMLGEDKALAKTENYKFYKCLLSIWERQSNCLDQARKYA